MSHPFKQYKRLGKNKKSTKSESAESPRRLAAAAESAGVYDFLYVDRARISALYAQLFPEGILTAVKKTAQQSFSDEGDIGSDLKVFKAETKSTEGGLEAIEHLFDASWSVPLEVLERLKSLSLVRETSKDAGLGSVILADCYLRVIDFASMEKLWEPAMKIFMASEAAAAQVKPELIPDLSEAMKAMPYAIHAHFATDSGLLWSSLQPTNLTIPTTDLTLKYGGTISGSWKLLYILDAWPDKGDPPDLRLWSAGPMIDGVLGAIHGLRTLIGRPPFWAGITPLMIFRDIGGWLPPKSQESQGP